MKLAGDWDGFTVTPKVLRDAGDAIIAEGRRTRTYKTTGKADDTGQIADAMGAGG